MHILGTLIGAPFGAVIIYPVFAIEGLGKDCKGLMTYNQLTTPYVWSCIYVVLKQDLLTVCLTGISFAGGRLLPGKQWSDWPR